MFSLCHQHPRALPAAFQPLCPAPLPAAAGGCCDPRAGLVEPHTLGLGLWIQPVQIPLQSLPDLQKTDTATQLGVTCLGVRVPVMSLSRSSLKTTSAEPWGAALVLAPVGCSSIHSTPGPRAALSPTKSAPTQAVSSRFHHQNAL